MKFAFRLDPVLGHRERIEKERAGDHARALRDLVAAEQLRDELGGRRTAARDLLTREHAQLDVDTLRATYVHLDYLDRAIVAAQQRVDACAAETERARLRLVDAAKDRKVLETLKQRRREAFDLEAALADQRELDDLNARLYDRASPLEGIS
jgi:flagellar FliJ protein